MRKMKDSGIEWIGEIPEHWNVGKISYFYDITLGKMVDNNSSEEQVNYLCAANIKWSGVNTEVEKKMFFSESEKEQYLLSDGDVLIMEGGMAGTSCIYHNEFAPCYIQNSVHRCRPINNSCNRFLYYWMFVVYHSEYISNICNKATIMHYTKEKVKSTPMLVVPLEEQTAIASYLDTQCAHIDSVIEKTKQSIEEYKKLKQAVITQAVTKGVRGEREMKDSGVEWIGEIPREWIVCKIGNYCSLKTGTTPSTTNSEWFDGEIEWFTPGDFSDKYELTNSQRKLSQKAVNDNACVIVEKDTVMIVGIGATAGKIGICKQTSSYNQQITALISDRIQPRYLMYWLIANTKHMRDTANYTTLPILNNQTISRYLLVVADTIDEQSEIAAYLDQKCAEIDTLITKKEKFLTELESYKKSMIYEYVTGKKEVP